MKSVRNSDYTVFINVKVDDGGEIYVKACAGEFNGENLKAVDNSVQPNKKEDVTPTQPADKNDDPTKPTEPTTQPTEDDKNFGDILDDLLNPGKEKQNKQVDEANMTEIANAIMLAIVNDESPSTEVLPHQWGFLFVYWFALAATSLEEFLGVVL